MFYFLLYFVYFLIFLLFANYIFVKLTCTRCECRTCLVGKTVLITGAVRGIGLEIAISLASRGCRLIIADILDASEAIEEIITHTNNRNIFAYKVDLGSFQSVRQFAGDLRKTERKIDILIHNAGISLESEMITEDGINTVIQVNFLASFLLTHLILDLLKANDETTKSRIIFTGSFFAFLLKFHLASLSKPQYETDRFSINYYRLSKLLNMIGANAFAKKLEPYGISVNSVHPGMVKTQLFATYYALKQYCLMDIVWLIGFAFFTKTPKQAAQTAIHASICKKLENVSGKFFCECRPFMQPAIMQNAQICDEIWMECEKLVKLESNEKIPTCN